MKKKNPLIIVIAVVVVLIIAILVVLYINNKKVNNVNNNMNNDVNSLNNNENDEIKHIDSFYNTVLTKEKDIRKLAKDYNLDDAIKDNSFVVGQTLYNKNIYDEFMENYKNKITSFVRVAQNTDEGDLVIYDILYYKNTDKVYLVIDLTRDEFSADNDRTIELREYKYTSEYSFNNHIDWFLHNNEINDENIYSDDTYNIFLVTSIK